MAKKQAASSAFDQMMSEFLNSENGALGPEELRDAYASIVVASRDGGE